MVGMAVADSVGAFLEFLPVGKKAASDTSGHELKSQMARSLAPESWKHTRFSHLKQLGHGIDVSAHIRIKFCGNRSCLY